MKLCKVPNCGGKSWSTGYCIKHYMQVRNNGKILERTVFDPNEFIIDGDTCKIGCYNQKNVFVGYALIDTEDAERCKKYKWYINMHGYVCSSGTIKLHTFIKGPGLHDHKDRNPLNNKKDNLRSTNASGNACNCDQKKSKSGYIGVTKMEKGGKVYWRAVIKKDGVNHYLGYYPTGELAALAYNKKAVELHGEFAMLNKIPLIRRNR